MDITADKLTKVYIRMRDARAKLKAEYEAQDSEIESQMDVLEAAMLELCKTSGADSLRTENGTIIRSIKTRYWTGDWAKMHQFIVENNAADLLERRIAQNAMKDWITENPDKLPPGLNTDSRYTVTVRRSS